MLNQAPAFWWRKPGWQALVLAPISKIYGFMATQRMRAAERTRVDAPVLCVGNFTVGGTGKTPTVIAFAEQAKARGLSPGILSRGHGGGLTEPKIVDAERDTADLVGDEPLLLATHAPVAVSPDRAAAARLLIQQGCDFLIMDDGLQSGRIHFDYALALVDASHGIGNGYVLPSGPLRAPLEEQLRYVTSLVTMGHGVAAKAVVRKASRAGMAVMEARMRSRDPGKLRGGRFLAFAGIGHPERFFETIVAAGGEVVVRRSFGDHHTFKPEELAELEAIAHKAGLDLISTAKDAVRLRHINMPPLFRSKLKVLEIETTFDDPDVPSAIIDQTVAAYRARRLGKTS